jgi:transposase
MPTGRPTKLTPELQEKLCQALESGDFVETACAIVGVSVASVYTWLALGRGEPVTVHGPKGPVALRARSEHRAFLEAFLRASALAEHRMVITLQAAARFGPGVHAIAGETVRVGDHRAASEFLRRRFPERWNRSYKDETVRSVTVNASSPEKANEIAEKMASDPSILDKAHALADALNSSK